MDNTVLRWNQNTGQKHLHIVRESLEIMKKRNSFKWERWIPPKQHLEINIARDSPKQ